MNPKVFILDVDGVMTTGHFLYSQDGKEYKVFGSHDNDGLKLLNDRVNLQFITADKRGFPITKKELLMIWGLNLNWFPNTTDLNIFEKSTASRI